MTMAEQISTVSSLDTLLRNMHIIQVTNVAPSATIDQMKELFGFLGKIRSIKIYPSDNYLIDTQSKVCYVQYSESWSVGVAQHLTNTVFIDRALIVVPIPDGIIPDEAKALALIDSNLQGFSSGLSPVINEISGIDGALVITTIDPRLTALGLPQYPPLPANMDPTKIEEIRRTVCIGNLAINVTADKLLNFVNQIGEVKYVRMAGDNDMQNARFAFVEFTEQMTVANILQYNGVLFEGLPLKVTHSNNAIVKPQSKGLEMPQKDIDEAMKRVKEAQSLIAAAIEPELSSTKRSRHRSRSRSRSRHRSRSRSRGSRRRRSRSRKRSVSRHRSSRRSRSPIKRSSRRSRSPIKRSRRDKSRSRSRGKRKTISPIRKKGRSRSRSRDRRRRHRTKSRSHSRSKSISKSKSSKDKKSSDRKRSPESKEKSSKKEKEAAYNGKDEVKPEKPKEHNATNSEAGPPVLTPEINVQNQDNEKQTMAETMVVNNDYDLEKSDNITNLNDVMQKLEDHKRDSADDEYQLLQFPKSPTPANLRSKESSSSPRKRLDMSASRSVSKTRSPGRQTSRSSSRIRSPSHTKQRSPTPIKSSHRKRSESPDVRRKRSRSTSRHKRSSYRSPRRYRRRSVTPKRYSRSPRRRSISPKRKSRSRSVTRRSRTPGQKRGSKRSSPMRKSRSPRRRSRSPKRDSKHHKRRKKSRESSHDSKKKKKSSRSDRESSKEMKVYRNYDEEEKGYDSSHDTKRESKDRVSIED